MLRAALAAFLACSSAACGPEKGVWKSGPVTTRLDGPVTVPLVESRLPLVEVRLDGHAALFALDYGAESTLVDEGFAERVGLELVPLANRVTSTKGDQVVRVYEHFVRIGELTIETARAEDIDALLFDMEHLGLGIDGILGVNVLNQWMVVFDDDAGELMILPPGELGTALSGVYAAGSEFECLEWVGEGPCPAIQLAFENDVVFDAVLDTGAVHCTFPETAVAELGLEPLGSRVSNHVGGSTEWPYYRVSSLAFEDVTFRNFEVDAEPRDDGLIGYSLLRRCVFVMDGPNEMFCFAFEPERL